MALAAAAAAPPFKNFLRLAFLESMDAPSRNFGWHEMYAFCAAAVNKKLSIKFLERNRLGDLYVRRSKQFHILAIIVPATSDAASGFRSTRVTTVSGFAGSAR